MMLVLITLSSDAVFVAVVAGDGVVAALRFFRCTSSGVDGAELLSA